MRWLHKAAFLLVCCGVQAADLGTIDFPTSGSRAAQKSFLRGVLYLHSFEYDDAREEFVKARESQPDFAMAYWGEAMTYNEPLWFNQDTAAARAALARLAPTPEQRLAKAPTQREKDYLRAVEILYGEGDKKRRDFAYADYMGNLWAKYPGDFEAAAFYSLAILGTSHGGRDFRTYMRAAAVAEEIFRKNPQHPGALHYLIHCYDDPVHAPLGLRAARLYAKIAPAAAHALHMPSHIFLALGMWDEVVSSNEDSWAASEERVKRKRLTVEDRGYHALWWLQYGYLQQGRYGDARRLLEIMEEDARRSPSRRIRYHLALMRAGHTIESGQQGKVGEELGLKDLDAPAEAGYLFARGYAAIGRGDLDAARKALEEIGTMRAGAAGGGAPHAGGHHPYPGDAQAVEIARKQLLGLIRLAEKNGREAVRLLEEAAGIEDQMSYEFGPPVPPKPAHELLGEILLNLERPLDARRHFERALARTPKRALSLLGLARAADRTGARELARDIYAELKSVRARADVQWEK